MMYEIAEDAYELVPVNAEKDTWVLALPEETCRREGFAVGTLDSLTCKKGLVQTSVLAPSAEVEDFVARVVAEEAVYFAEMKRRGD